MKIKHAPFNPMWGNLSTICESMENEGWMLSHIVPVDNYQAVAVFVRPDEKTEKGKNGSYL